MVNSKFEKIQKMDLVVMRYFNMKIEDKDEQTNRKFPQSMENTSSCCKFQARLGPTVKDYSGDGR